VPSSSVPSGERNSLNKLYLTSYETEFVEKLKADCEFRELWKEREARRRVVSARIEARIRQNLSQKELAKRLV
jgi:hypothetical protein